MSAFPYVHLSVVSSNLVAFARSTCFHLTPSLPSPPLPPQKQKSAAKVDIVARAKEWGCKVVYVDELMAELRKLKPVPQNSKVTAITTNRPFTTWGKR